MLTAIPHKSREEICEIRGRPVWGRTEIKGPTVSRFPSFRWKPFPEFHHFRPMCLSHANHRLFFITITRDFFKTCLSRKGPQQMPLAIASVNYVGDQGLWFWQHLADMFCVECPMFNVRWSFRKLRNDQPAKLQLCVCRSWKKSNGFIPSNIWNLETKSTHKEKNISKPHLAQCLEKTVNKVKNKVKHQEL